MSTAALRNIAIILLLAGAVYFVPGGGDAAALIGALLSTAILASFVMLAARFYRERRLDLVGLGDRWRATLYGAVAVIVLAMAALTFVAARSAAVPVGTKLEPTHQVVVQPGQTLWEIAESKHIGGLTARPEEYERRVIGFLDRALRP